MYNNLIKNKRLILSLLLLLASLFVGSQALPSAHAQFTGLVCITASTTATSCPTSPASVGPFTAGQTFTVGVFIQASEAMGGLDIYVQSNNAYVNPTGAALGNLIAGPSLTSICINGAATVGSCTVGTANGPGVVEVTTIESSGSNECGGISPCSGMAFTITYQVVGTTSTVALSLSYPTAAGCSASSVSSPPNTCVEVADSTGTVLSENIQGATVSAPQVSLTGLVCIIYPATATSCPSAPFMFGPFNVGQTFTVGVFVQNSQPLAAFDIYVAVNATFLTPTNVTLGNLIETPASGAFTTRCVNDQSLQGFCTPNSANGPGVVEVGAFEDTGLNSTTCGTTSCSGLAFAITYRVVGKIPSTPIYYPRPPRGNDNACLPSSVGTTDICLTIFAANGNILPENVQGAMVTQIVFDDATTIGLSCVPNPVVVGPPGTKCTATVKDTNSTAPTSPLGSVEFFGSDGSFSPNPCLLSGGSPNPNTCSVTYTPSHVDTGTHSIDCTYSGDPGVHLGSFCITFFLTVLKATPSVSTAVINDQTGVSPPAAGVPLGTSLHDVAVLLGGFPVTGVSGTVTYTLYPNSKCTAGTGTVVTIRSVGASNNVLGSGSVTPVAGSYSFNAMYSGDSDNNAVTSACEQFTVVQIITAGKLHWTHHLSLVKTGNIQTWTTTVANPLTTSFNVVVRITGTSTTNPLLTFDVTCGVTCVNTDAGGVNSTPGLTPVSVPAGTSSLSFSFNQAISPSFVNNKFTFTATLYWSLGTGYTPSSTKSGAFAVVP